MASWHLSLCFLIMGPRCPVVRTRCPSWAADSVQQQMGREELAPQTTAAGVYFVKYLGAQRGITWARSWSPASPPLPVPQVIRSLLTKATWPRLRRFPTLHTTWSPACCLASLRRCHGVALVSRRAVDSLQSLFPTFSLLWTLLFVNLLLFLAGSLVKDFVQQAI